MCKCPAPAKCRRCGTPFCRDHAPAWRERCERCEAEYDRQLALYKSPEGRSPLFRATAGVGFGAGMLMLTLLLLEGGLGYTLDEPGKRLHKNTRNLLLGRHRRKFLAERMHQLPGRNEEEEGSSRD